MQYVGPDEICGFLQQYVMPCQRWKAALKSQLKCSGQRDYGVMKQSEGPWWSSAGISTLALFFHGHVPMLNLWRDVSDDQYLAN
jgi:hypothetical protein